MDWQPAGVLSDARRLHIAILLHSGLVLVHGGTQFGAEALRTAELFNPDTNEWTPTRSSCLGRISHTATMLPDGSVLVVGGAGLTGQQTFFSEVEIFEPSTQNWTFTSPCIFRRSYHAATELADGRVLVMGGQGLNAEGVQIDLSSAEIFDPGMHTWTLTDSLKHTRYGHTATLLSDGRVLVVGGALDTTELFNPATQTWTVGESLFYAPFGQTATRLQDGKVLVAGGGVKSCAVFNPDSGHWYQVGNLNQARVNHTACLLLGGNVMVVGGSDPQSVEFYNPETAEWTRGPDMITPRGYATQTLLRWDRHGPIENKVLVASGTRGSSFIPLNSAELFTSGEVNA
jgi:hypothetical protein